MCAASLRISSALFVLLPGIVLAQPPRGFQPPGGPFPGMMPQGSPLILLSQKVVQDDLKLTREQQAKIADLRIKEMRALPPLQPGTTPDKMMEKMKEAAKATEAALAGILNEDQAQRLKQITLQQRGAIALAEPEVAKAVGLSEEQGKKISDAIAASTTSRAALMQRPPTNLAAVRKAMEQIDKKTNDAIAGLLTEEQKKKWEEMKGKPIKGLVTQPMGPFQPPR